MVYLPVSPTSHILLGEVSTNGRFTSKGMMLLGNRFIFHQVIFKRGHDVISISGLDSSICRKETEFPPSRSL